MMFRFSPETLYRHSDIFLCNILNRFLFQTPLGDCSCIFAANLKERCHAQIQIKTKGGQVSPFSRKDLGAAIKSNNQAMDYLAKNYLDRGCRLNLLGYIAIC